MRVIPTRGKVDSTIPSARHQPRSSCSNVQMSANAFETRPKKSLTLIQFTGTISNLGLWFFLMFLMLSQLLTAVRNTTSRNIENLYGQEPSSGLYSIPGQNDEPYSDRMVVCVRRGQSFKAMSLNEALNYGSAVIEDSSGSAINGYRIVYRTGHDLSETAKQQWTQTCRLMNASLSGIFQACGDLGYSNLTRDSLRIVDGLHSKHLKNIPNVLPILIMPFWDNALTARYTIPAWDGHACMFRLQGRFEDATQQKQYLVGVNRIIREAQTIAWLGRPGGEWRNGWYEDTQGMRWYSDVVAKDLVNNYGLFPRRFDPSIGKELFCDLNSDCSLNVLPSTWSAELTSTLYLSTETSIAISNGTRFGFFLYRSAGLSVVTCIYDFSAFISNASVIALLCRWMIAMVILHRGYTKGVSDWHSTGLGSIANSSSFTYLPIAMLPRLKMILAAFFTVGCGFEGQQKALGDSWFVIYPSIVDFVLIYASLLNMLTKVLRRRMNDGIFPFTIVVLSAIHFFRQNITRLSFVGVGGRISTLVGSDEFEQMTLADILFTSAGLRLGGNVRFLLWLKLLVLSLSFLSIFLSKNMALHSKRSRAHYPCRVEQVLAVRACNVGGIGHPASAYVFARNQQMPAELLNAYELSRLGYVVLGNRYLMKSEDWWVLTSMSQIKSIYSLWNYRVMAFRLTETSNDEGEKMFQVSSRGRLMSIHDSELNSIAWWDIDARPLV